MSEYEKLDDYYVSIMFAGCINRKYRGMWGPDIYVCDQLIRLAQAIPFNIAEGNGCAAEAVLFRLDNHSLG